MQISSIVDIVNGKLLNSPAISFITQIHTNPSKINEGDLFLAKNKQDIQDAINNGAFAVLYDFDTQIIDNEIAWIQVEDITNAMIKLLRFILSNKNVKSFYCDDVSLEFLKIYASTNILLLTNKVSYDFEKLKNIKGNMIVFSTNQKYLLNIQPITKNFIITKFKVQNLIVHSLFSTSFSYKGIYYKLQLPYMYINHFLKVSKFLKTTLDLHKIKKLQYFLPIFIDKNLQVVDFGMSNKIILANTNKNIISKEIRYLKKFYKYGKILIIDKIKDDDILSTIKTSDFNILYIKGYSYDYIKNLLEDTQDRLSYFKF